MSSNRRRYKKSTDPRVVFHLRLSQDERDQILFVMYETGIKDISKAIRFCVSEKANQLREETMKGCD